VASMGMAETRLVTVVLHLLLVVIIMAVITVVTTAKMDGNPKVFRVAQRVSHAMYMNMKPNMHSYRQSIRHRHIL
jgi:hypothetical protein